MTRPRSTNNWLYRSKAEPDVHKLREEQEEERGKRGEKKEREEKEGRVRRERERERERERGISSVEYLMQITTILQ